MPKKIIELSQKRIQTLLNDMEKHGWYYKGHKTFIDAMKGEIEEAEEELKENNSVFLEDELGDVFWTYICLLESLRQEGKITSIEKVFERSYTKFSERISLETGENNKDWGEIKKIQKEKLQQEHEEKYGKN